MYKYLVIYIMLVLALAGCKQATPLSTTSPLPLRETQFASPLDGTPVPEPVETVVVPTQDPKLGTITGSIVMQGQPAGVFPATLFLGDPTGSDPVGAYVSLDASTAPQGYVLPDGSFVFPNVPPGTYAILAWTPAGAYVVPDPSAGTTWLIEISGSESFDAGSIVVPPFQSQQ